jgi:hypothetical protein
MVLVFIWGWVDLSPFGSTVSSKFLARPTTTEDSAFGLPLSFQVGKGKQ